MSKNFEYSVAIRTLGTGGEKYRQEIESLHNQTVKPKHIFVFIAEGYPRPDFQVGIEEYVPVHKGLVHQRAASLQGVDTEYLLILDDDIYFPDDAVEKLYDAMIARNADCIAPETFNNENMNLVHKLGYYAANGVIARGDDEWAIKIMRNGTFSFNGSPKKGGVYLTQSFPGTACFCRTEAFRGIHYENELWIDQFPAGTFGEDQVMAYKFHRNGYKVLTAYDTGILHLDAGTNNVHEKPYHKIKFRAMSYYLTWHRTRYAVKGNSFGEKFLCSCAYLWRFFMGCCTRVIYSLVRLQPKHLIAYIHGNLAGIGFVWTKEYRSLCNFLLK
ncbi:MAG: glycosyltransferase [Bacteroidaceae bacterium]|nr:glycosyltransferase [Bacteroidaceae bacterium]